MHPAFDFIKTGAKTRAPWLWVAVARIATAAGLQDRARGTGRAWIERRLGRDRRPDRAVAQNLSNSVLFGKNFRSRFLLERGTARGSNLAGPREGVFLRRPGGRETPLADAPLCERMQAAGRGRRLTRPAPRRCDRGTGEERGPRSLRPEVRRPNGAAPEPTLIGRNADPSDQSRPVPTGSR